MGPATSEELSGTVERIVYENLETGYRVFVISTAQNSATATGCTADIKAGQEVTIRGAWTTHPKFGKQFQVTHCIVKLPTSIRGLQAFLGSGAIKGIGKIYAQRLIDAFGEQVLEVIDKHPKRLYSVSGLGDKRVETITQSWREHKEIAHIMVFLQDKGISPAYAHKIYKKYGQQSVKVVQNNPYCLAEQVWGIGFKIADAIAKNLGFDQLSPFRIQAGIVHAINEAIGSGHLYVAAAELKTRALQLLELDDSQETTTLLKAALEQLHGDKKIVLIQAETDYLITLPTAYNAERSVAEKIKAILAYASPLQLPIDAIYQELRMQQGSIQLNDDQQRGIMAALQSKITIITGGPGTGKTTLITQFLNALDRFHVRYKLAAPTGRAAKRMFESTQRSASTIHRLLEFDPMRMQFKHNEQNTLNADIFIIDEASMIDIFLANALLKAIPLHAHLIFIGDIDQLPPVGAGNFLRDLIASEKIICVKLTEIFRQAQHSLITINAHRINSGTFPTSALPETAKDFIWIKEELPERVSAHLQTIFNHHLKQHHIAPHDSIVLTPMNRGIAGTHKLNRELQTLLNPSAKTSFTYGLTQFKEGDRVMQIKNNYEKFVFNGDIGTIGTIDLEDQTMHIHYAERIISYQFGELDELVLAYAITVHKSQGSEYSAVIIPLFAQHFTLLARNLVYTAITRAKKLCIIIGQPKALAIAIRNNKSSQRTTLLVKLLTTEVSCV